MTFEKYFQKLVHSNEELLIYLDLLNVLIAETVKDISDERTEGVILVECADSEIHKTATNTTVWNLHEYVQELVNFSVLISLYRLVGEAVE